MGEQVRADRHALARGDVLAMAAMTSRFERGSLSGLFIAKADGRISYLETVGLSGEPLRVADLPTLYSFPDPRGMAYSAPMLYVYDGESHQIWSVDMSGGSYEESTRSFETRFREPRQMAVSPEGVLAVIDGDRLMFLEEGHDVDVYVNSVFPEPTGLAFSAWDTLHVLDRVRSSLTTIKLARLSDGRLRFRPEEEVALGLDWHALAVYKGVVYLASHDKVFAHIESDNKLIPVLPEPVAFDDILDIALNDDGLYVLTHEGRLEVLPRPEPIELMLEATAPASQEALLDFYEYLMGLDRLPTRRVQARQRFERLEDFLFQEGVLLAPIGARDADIKVYDDPQKSVYGLTQQLEALKGKSDGFFEKLPSLQELLKRDSEAAQPVAPWAEVVCALNPGFCDGRTPAGIEQDDLLAVPDVRIDVALGRKRVYLESRSIRSYLENLVFTERFRDAAYRPAFLKRLNPNYEGFPDDKVLEISQGTALLPAEQWSVTAAVPYSEYENRDSGLWRFEELFEDVSVHSRTGLSVRAARSMLLPQPPPDPSDPLDLCRELQLFNKEWKLSINYPFDAGGGEVVGRRVRVGVIEDGITVARRHQIFGLDKESPAWHSFSETAELVADPKPASFETGDQIVKKHDAYSPDADHGTHVSALIAGRDGPCWSGLLPESRLVLIDLTDGGHMSRNISKAISERVFVFNVSQSRQEPWEELFGKIKDDGRALWVVAAGNSSMDLDEEDAPKVPAPARWGERPNVIAVTASDARGKIVEEFANTGKKYVDLVAPGEDIYSASEQHMYGPASGTSQSTPQVAAAAALLVDRAGERLVPGDAKARLIATAVWKPDFDYEGEVWGGFLDFTAATRFADRNIVVTTLGDSLNPKQIHSIELKDEDVKILVANDAHYYERGTDQGATAPEKLKFSQILSLQKLDAGKYRVVLKEPGTDQLKILLDAKLEDTNTLGLKNKLKCKEFELFDPVTGEFKQDDGCKGGLSITEISRYVQGGQYRVAWP